MDDSFIDKYVQPTVRRIEKEIDSGNLRSVHKFNQYMHWMKTNLKEIAADQLNNTEGVDQLTSDLVVYLKENFDIHSKRLKVQEAELSHLIKSIEDNDLMNMAKRIFGRKKGDDKIKPEIAIILLKRWRNTNKGLRTIFSRVQQMSVEDLSEFVRLRNWKAIEEGEASTSYKEAELFIPRNRDEPEEKYRKRSQEKIDVLRKCNSVHQVHDVRDEFDSLEPFQLVTVHAAIYCRANRLLLNAHVGSGKTRTALVYAQAIQSRRPDFTVIVLGPSASLDSFKIESKRFPDLTMEMYGFTKFVSFSNNYPKNYWKKVVLIIDEAHLLNTDIKETVDRRTGEVKVQGKVAKYIVEKSILCSYVLLLTATPVLHHVSKFLNLYTILTRGRLKSLDFRKEVLGGKIVDSLLGKVIVKTMEADNALYPRKYTKNVDIVIGPSDHPEFYRFYYQRQKQGIDPFYTLMRQTEVKTDEAQNPLLTELVKIVNNTRTKTVVYTPWTKYGVENITKKLDEEKILYKVYSGKQNLAEREKIKDYYNRCPYNTPIVLIITNAGSQGLNLTGSGNIVLLDTRFSKKQEEQIIGRVFRKNSHIKLDVDQQSVTVWNVRLVKADRLAEDDPNPFTASQMMLKTQNDKISDVEYLETLLQYISERSFDKLIKFYGQKHNGGLPNIKNSCYANSVIQMMNALLPDLKPGNDDYPLVRILHSLRSHQQPSKKDLEELIVDTMGKHTGCQEDAAEFMSKLLLNPWFHPFRYQFSVQVVTKSECGICKTSRKKAEKSDIESFVTLILIPGLKKKTKFTKLIEYYQKNDIREMKTSDCKCDTTDKANIVFRQHIIPMGEFIIFSLNRVETTEFVSQKETGTKDSSPERKNIIIDWEDVIELNKEKWEIFAVVQHIGKKANSGHYIVSIKSKNGQWDIFNDEKVTRNIHSPSPNGTEVIFVYKKKH